MCTLKMFMCRLWGEKMEERLKTYLTYAEKAVEEGMDGADREQLRKEMLVQIRFFQHERLIHLIVTITFAILTLLSLIGCFLVENKWMLVLTMLFIMLLIPYIRHYYLLENGVQKLYTYYDKLAERKLSA